MLATKTLLDMHVKHAKMTANNFEWFQTTVSKLSTDDLNRAQLLSEIKLAIGALPSAQQKLIVPNLQLENILDCLNSSET
jgi:hypothetical protein